MNLAKIIIVEKDFQLIAVRLADAPDFFNIVRDNQEHFSRFDFTSPRFDRLEEVVDVIQGLIEYQQEGLGVSYGAWLGNQLIGLLTINKIDWEFKIADAGYWLAQSATGKGYASKAFLALVDYCFSELQMENITAHVATTNLRSQNLLLKMGFKKQILLRKKMKVRGHYVDEFRYRLRKKQ